MVRVESEGVMYVMIWGWEEYSVDGVKSILGAPVDKFRDIGRLFETVLVLLGQS